MILRNIIKDCKNNTSITAINNSAKELIKFFNSSRCTNIMKKAVINRFGTFYFTTYKRACKYFSADKKESMDQLAKEAGLALNLMFDHNKPYTYVTISTKGNDITNANILTASKIIEIAQTMLATKDKNLYKHQREITKQKVNKEIANSLQSKISKRQMIDLTLKQLFSDHNKLKNYRNSTKFNRYKTLTKNIQLLKTIERSNDTKWTFKKVYSIYSKHHNVINKDTKVTVPKDYVQYILLQQLFHETKYFNNSVKDNVSKLDDNDIEYIWDLLDDIGVIKSVYESPSQAWVKDLITSDSIIVAYAPLIPFRSHVYDYHIDKYGQLHSNKDYTIVNFKRIDLK